jgi:hypothetical protein
MAELQIEIMRFADRFVNILGQAYEDIKKL